MNNLPKHHRGGAPEALAQANARLAAASIAMAGLKVKADPP